MKHNLSFALLFLPAATTAQLVRVCGSSYSDASFNCTVNPSCPTGDGCPPERDTCFALPQESCLTPPTAAPIVAPIQACGVDYETAKINCDRLCEMGCDPSEACFNILPSECVVPQAESEIIVDPQFSVEATEVSVCGTSFADAAANCETNAVCNPLESDCVPGQACFVVPLSNCTAINTTAPTIEALSPAPTAPPVKPTHKFVCGEDYGDAERNCNTNTGCPTGDGCAGGLTCFAVPYGNCPDPQAATTTTVAATEDATTVAPDGAEPEVVFEPGNTTETGTTEAASTEATSTGAANLLYCGESYELAEQNCFTNLPCPGGGGCPAGQACFGISSECKSPEPTPSLSEFPSISPTAFVNTTEDTPALRTLEPSLSPVTAAPTESPVVNDKFCGTNYTDAEASCSFDNACPGGFECPSGKICFTGIVCAATATPGTSPSSVDETSTSGPTVGGTSTATSQETINLDSLLIYRYCGFSPDDARDNCATATPCLDGTDDECPAMQTCFELEEPCSAVPGDVPAVTPVTPVTLAPSVPATDKPVFDPSITSFCGDDYNDAQENCYYNTPCPGNSNAECDNGQTCFPGIVTCEIPETQAPTPALSSGANATTTNATVTMAPTVSPTTPKPVFDLSGYENDSTGGDGSGCSTRGVGMVMSTLVGVIAALLM